jgi:hypothetical protein
VLSYIKVSERNARKGFKNICIIESCMRASRNEEEQNSIHILNSIFYDESSKIIKRFIFE